MATAAGSAVRFKSNYAVSRRIEPFYKGGALHPAGPPHSLLSVLHPLFSRGHHFICSQP
uniref:Uncharacterized protein n=1 Tax=Pavo cristatus TaxID=9049 RepID=A0A8C9EUZ2_PAVCR